MELNRLLSIVIPTYNRAEKLEDTLVSLLKSPVSGCRITILNNKSTDNTLDVCEKYSALFENFNVVTHPVNLGSGSANYIHSINYCNTDYIWMLSDDDHYDFSCFSDVEEKLKEGSCSIIQVGAHNDGEWNWGVYDTPKNLQNKGYRYFKYSSFLPCSIFKYSFFVKYIKEAYDFIYFWYPHLPCLLNAYDANEPIYVSKRRIVEASIGVQEYSYYIPMRGWIIASIFLNDIDSKRNLCLSLYDNTKPLWMIGALLGQYNKEMDYRFVRCKLLEIMNIRDRIFYYLLYYPYRMRTYIKRFF